MNQVVKLASFYKDLNKDHRFGQPEVGHFNIFRVEDIAAKQGKHVNYNRHEFFKITFVKAHGYIHYADRSVETNGTALIFTNPTIPFYWENIGTERSGYACIFTEAFFNRYDSIKDCRVFQSADNGILILSDEHSKRFEELFVRMEQELQTDYEYKFDLLRNLLMELVHYAQKLQPAPSRSLTTTNAAERITRLFSDLLERQFPIEMTGQSIRLKTANEFAAALNIHVNHLNKSLKAITGYTTIQLINDRICQEARLLLKGTNWTVAEISSCLGFEEPNHFSTFFKCRCNATPKEFRNIKID